jgi:hypothetical protein
MNEIVEWVERLSQTDRLTSEVAMILLPIGFILVPLGYALAAMAWCPDLLFGHRRLFYRLLLVLAGSGIVACIGVAWAYAGICLYLSFEGRIARPRSIAALVIGPPAVGIIFCAFAGVIGKRS